MKAGNSGCQKPEPSRQTWVESSYLHELTGIHGEKPALRPLCRVRSLWLSLGGISPALSSPSGTRWPFPAACSQVCAKTAQGRCSRAFPRELAGATCCPCGRLVFPCASICCMKLSSAWWQALTAFPAFHCMKWKLLAVLRASRLPSFVGRAHTAPEQSQRCSCPWGSPYTTLC